MGKAGKWLFSTLLIHRFETVFFVVPMCAWGSLIAFAAGQGSVQLLVLGFILNLTSVYNGFLANTYCDYELDKGSSSKKAITEAVQFIGKRKVLALYGAEILAITFIFYRYHHLYGSPAADLWFWLGIFGRYSYNFRPLRFKERGSLNMIVYALNFGVMPIVLVWSLVSGVYPLGLLLILGGGFLTMASQALWGAAVDYDSDKESGARTVAVAFGRRRALFFSQLFMALTVPLLVSGMYLISTPRLGPYTHNAVIGLSIIVAGFFYSIGDRFRYVLAADERAVALRLHDKYRQLRWLVAQSTSVVVGSVVLTL